MDQTASPPTDIDPVSIRRRRDMYHQTVHYLYDMIPRQPGESADVFEFRFRGAVDHVASLLPANTDETDIALHYVAAGLHAKECKRLAVGNAGNPAAVVKLNAQYASMARQARGYRTLLLRVQTARYKREANDKACAQDEWVDHCAFGWMSEAVGELFPPGQAVRHEIALVEAPQPEPVTTPATVTHPAPATARPQNTPAASAVQPRAAPEDADIEFSDAELLKFLESCDRDGNFNPLDPDALSVIGDAAKPRLHGPGSPESRR